MKKGTNPYGKCEQSEHSSACRRHPHKVIPSGLREDLREKFLKFMALQGICKSSTAEVTKEYAKFAKFNDPVFAPLLQSFKI